LFNYETEAALLGAVMTEARIADMIGEIVSPDEFYYPLHGRIFAAVLNEVANGRQPSPILLRNQFVDDPDISSYGGPGYLTNLTGSGAAIVGARDFAKSIADLAKRRRLLDKMRLLTDDVMTRIDQPVEDLVDSLDGAMSEALQRSEIASAASIADAWDITMREIEDEAAGRAPRGIEIQRLPDWNAVVGQMRAGEVTILAGRPSMGKTALSLAVLLGAGQAGAGSLFISLEMKKKELMKRVITDLIYKHGESASFEQVKSGKFNEFDRGRIADARKAIDSWPVQIYDPPTLRIGRLAMTIRRYQRRMAGKGQHLKVVIIDYLGLIHPDNAKASRYEQVALISRTVKQIANECGVHIVVLSQLNRQVEQREDKRPVLSDLRDAGDIEQDADNVVFVYREQYYLERSEPDPSDLKKRPGWETSMDAARDRVELICAKRRNGGVGKRTCWYFASHQAVRGSRFYQDMNV
jgi:replicative DNA helicase